MGRLIFKSIVLSMLLISSNLYAKSQECNLFFNPGFEKGTNGWDLFTSDTKLSTKEYSGKYAIKYSSGGIGQEIENFPQTDGKTDYYLQGYYKTDRSPYNMWIGIEYFDENWNLLSDDALELKKSSNYKKFSITTTPPVNTKHVTFWSWSDSSRMSKTYLDDLIFQPIKCDALNISPKITTIKNQKNIKGFEVTLNIEAKDEDGDKLTYSATGLPTGLTINPQSGYIKGIPTKLGLFAVMVTVTDGNGGKDSKTFSWEITREQTSSCNILQNSSFETDTDGWIVYGANSLTNDGYKGGKAIKIRDGGLEQISERLDGEDTYQFNGYYKTVGKTDGIWAGMAFFDSAKNFISAKTFYLKDSDTYTKFIINTTTTENVKYIQGWIWASAVENSGEIIIDDIKISSSACYDYALASSLPPKGLKPNEVPQFIIIGFDDNTKTEGIDWAINLLDNKQNSDGSKARASFYMNTIGLRQWEEDNPANLIQAVKRLALTSNEIGNHTDNHQRNLPTNDQNEFFRLIKKLDKDAWQTRIFAANNDLANLTDINIDRIKGFRAPYLLYNQYSMSIIKESGFLYDCSIEDGYSPEFDGTNFRWPYQLDEGSPGHNETWHGSNHNSEKIDIKTVKGLWELPNHPFMIPTDNEGLKYNITPGLWDRIKAKIPYVYDYKITGLDYNIWSLAGVNKTEFLGILKYNLDLRLKGNRAPFMIGAHSQYYTKEWADAHAPNATVQEMREAMREFIEYALSKDVVRIRPGVDVINWCNDPKPLK